MTERLTLFYARAAIAAGFLSAVASRFGLWSGRPLREAFHAFIVDTASTTAFLPTRFAPVLAVAATACELSLGVALLAGVALRHVGIASAALLATFAIAMTLSQGVKSPFDYSVWAASAAALLLARATPPVSRSTR
jgi:putative oxidoreductase